MDSRTPHDRQRVERVAGSRRARLTPAQGTDADPATPPEDGGPGPTPTTAASGPNDERMRREVPPHY